MSTTTVQDDYLICGEYKEQINNKSAEHPGFITFQHQNGNYYFAWVNGDEIVMRSEAYPDADKMERGIKAILKNCDLVERYSVIEEHGAHLLLLWGGGNHQAHSGNREQHSEIGRSCPQKSREALNALLQFKGNDFANKVVPIANATAATSNKSTTGVAAAAAVTGGLAAAASLSSTASSATSSGTSTSRETAAAVGASTITDTAAAATRGSMGWLKWLLPVLIGAGGYLLWKNYSSKDTSASTGEVKTAVNAEVKDTTSTTTTNIAVAIPTKESLNVKLADGVEINAFKGGIEDRMVTFLNDKAALIDSTKKGDYWYDFDNLNFEFGKTTITKESLGQIGNIVAILKAYPNTKMKIGAYTDKKGDDAGNMKLSQARADAVLIAIKVAGGNVAQITKAEGYGETLAVVAETATDEERLKDRRTSIKIVSK
jgi:outer membrane protein OmpA-like peptidoglycan-associated protein